MYQGLVVWVGLVVGQGPAPPQAPTPPQALRKSLTEYQLAQRMAQSTGKPLAVFVGQKERKISGWITCSADLKDVPSPCVVVKRRENIYCLPGNPTDDEINGVGTEKKANFVSPMSFVPASVPLLRGGGC